MPRFIKHYYQMNIHIALKELREEIYRRMLKLEWVYNFEPFFKKHDITYIPLQNRLIGQIQKELKCITLGYITKKRSIIYYSTP